MSTIEAMESCQEGYVLEFMIFINELKLFAHDDSIKALGMGKSIK
jgi:hypothetical protein